MIKYLLAVALALGGLSTVAKASEYCSRDWAPSAEAAKACSAFANEGEKCDSGEVLLSGGKQKWVCHVTNGSKVYDSCPAQCKDHAIKLAKAECERDGNDAAKCRLVNGDGNCCLVDP